MRLRELAEGPLRVLVLACDKDEDPIDAVTAALDEHRVHAAAVTGVGALRSARLGYFDPQQRDYLPIDVAEQVEVVSLLGDVAEVDGRAALHLHAVLARRDGSTVGGHLLGGRVWPVLEVVVTEVAAKLAKRYDPETGLMLLGPRGEP